MRRSELMPGLGDLRLAQLLARKPEWQLLCDDAFREVLTIAGVPAERIGALDAPAPAGADAIRIVCTDGNEQVWVAAARARGATAIGLFADLLPRLLASAPPRFRTAQAPDPAQRYALVSLPRSGSTALAQELARIGAGHPREHIRPPLIEFARHPDLTGFALKRWWRLLTRSQTANGVFGTKLIWGFLTGFKAVLDPAERAWLDRELGGYRLYHLFRADKLEQAVSDYVARATRVWHLWERNADYQDRLRAIAQVDYDDVRHTCEKLRAGEADLLRYLDDLGAEVRTIDFDSICADVAAEAHGIARDVGLTVSGQSARKPSASLQRTRSSLHDEIVAHLRPEMG